MNLIDAGALLDSIGISRDMRWLLDGTYNDLLYAIRWYHLLKSPEEVDNDG